LNGDFPAAKELKRLDRTTIQRIDAKIAELARDPLNSRLSRQMETDPEARYSRVGDWRIIYRVNEAQGIIDIVAVKPRGKLTENNQDFPGIGNCSPTRPVPDRLSLEKLSGKSAGDGQWRTKRIVIIYLKQKDSSLIFRTK
jgi:mRNA interferase RelE/StbE